MKDKALDAAGRALGGLYLSDEVLSQTHDRHEYVDTETKFMFHDLYGNPMMVENIRIIEWKPKNKDNG